MRRERLLIWMAAFVFTIINIPVDSITSARGKMVYGQETREEPQTEADLERLGYERLTEPISIYTIISIRNCYSRDPVSAIDPDDWENLDCLVEGTLTIWGKVDETDGEMIQRISWSLKTSPPFDWRNFFPSLPDEYYRIRPLADYYPLCPWRGFMTLYRDLKKQENRFSGFYRQRNFERSLREFCEYLINPWPGKILSQSSSNQPQLWNGIRSSSRSSTMRPSRLLLPVQVPDRDPPRISGPLPLSPPYQPWPPEVIPERPDPRLWEEAGLGGMFVHRNILRRYGLPPDGLLRDCQVAPEDFEGVGRPLARPIPESVLEQIRRGYYNLCALDWPLCQIERQVSQPEERQPKPEPEERQPKSEIPKAHDVLLLDISGSMGRNMGALKAALNMFLYGIIPYQDLISVVFYSDGTEVIWQYAYADSKGSRATMVNVITPRMQAQGKTNMPAGLDACGPILSSNPRGYPPVIYIFTDENPVVNPTIRHRLEELASQDVEIYIIGFGPMSVDAEAVDDITGHENSYYHYEDDALDLRRFIFGARGY